MDNLLNFDNFFFPEGYNTSFFPGVSASWKEEMYPSTYVGKMRKMNVILPPSYEAGKKFPVLYLLHGIGGDENEWKAAGPEFLSANLVSEKKAEEMIIVLVNERVRENDAKDAADIFTKEHFESFDRFGKELLLDIMPFMEAHYSIKTGRENTAIAGLSMGGRESLYIGLSHPEIFGYIGAFSPAFGLLPYANNGVAEEGLLKEEGFVLPETYKDNTYLTIIHGDHDGVVYDEPNKYHAALEKNQTKHEFFLLDGDHDFDVWSKSLYYFLQNIF